MQTEQIPWSPNQTIKISPFESYTVEEELGAGGFGAVYLVRAAQFDSVRYAVKRAHFQDDAARRIFMRELAIWIGLPEHPHVACCRFFRTVGSELLIFSDHAEGGALSSWIGQARLNVGLAVDFAIQAAWGLHAVHELGVVHRDVKPQNLLISGLSVKVADFGISGRYWTGSAEDSYRSPTLTAVAGTLPYRSPEQANRWGRIDRRSDIWSWAATLLEMLKGRLDWQNEVQLQRRLHTYLEEHAIPPRLAQLLIDCLDADANQRPQNLLSPARTLAGVYQDLVGAQYPNAEPLFPTADLMREHDRRIEVVVQWSDPREAVATYAAKGGEDIQDVTRQLPPRGGSRRGQAATDLAWFTEALRLAEGAADPGGPEHQVSLSALLTQKGFVHEHLGDFGGAIKCYTDAISVRQQFEGARYTVGDSFLGVAYGNLGAALLKRGSLNEALNAHRRAGEILADLVGHDGDKDVERDLATQRMAAANILDIQHRFEESIDEYNAAIAALAGLVQEGVDDERVQERAITLTGARVNKGIALYNAKRPSEALPEFDEAITYRARLVATGREEFMAPLASAHGHKGLALTALERYEAAVHEYDQAIGILIDLVHCRDHREEANALAAAHVNKGMALRRKGSTAEALGELRKATTLYRELLDQEGKVDRAGPLAETLMIMGNALVDLEAFDEAVQNYDESIRIRETLVEQGRIDVLLGLAMAHFNKGNALAKRKATAEAVLEYDNAIALFEDPSLTPFADELITARAAKVKALLASGDLSQILQQHTGPSDSNRPTNKQPRTATRRVPLDARTRFLIMVTAPAVGGVVRKLDVTFADGVELTGLRVEGTTLEIPTEHADKEIASVSVPTNQHSPAG